MTDLPRRVHIHEEGPREGFQIERGAIPTARKVELIERLAETGVTHIQIVSFVNPKAVPGMADADEVVRLLRAKPGVAYTPMWLNEKGFDRALENPKLAVEGFIVLSASEAFLKRNQNRTPAQLAEEQDRMMSRYKTAGVPLDSGFVMAAFGCNFEGDIPPARVVALTSQLLDIAAAHDVACPRVILADTMGWATPGSIKRVVGAVRERHPDLELALHLHDTRGMGIANAYAGLEMGVARYDAAVAGLGGCPFAGHKGAAGNVCTEDLVFMCHEMGIDTGIDLEAMIDCANLAEDIVGHPLPGSVMKGGSLGRLRASIAAAAAA
jgi:hydroxymethylglutaryl-CoA lyase